MRVFGAGVQQRPVDGQLDLADLGLVGGCSLLVELVDDLVGAELVGPGWSGRAARGVSPRWGRLLGAGS